MQLFEQMADLSGRECAERDELQVSAHPSIPELGIGLS